jgi:hypothetical protein
MLLRISLFCSLILHLKSRQPAALGMYGKGWNDPVESSPARGSDHACGSCLHVELERFGRWSVYVYAPVTGFLYGVNPYHIRSSLLEEASTAAPALEVNHAVKVKHMCLAPGEGNLVLVRMTSSPHNVHIICTCAMYNGLQDNL